MSSPNLSLSGFFGPRPGLTAVRAVGHVHHPFPTGAVHEGAHHLSAWPCSNAWCSDGCVWLCICQIWRDLTWFNQLDQLGTTSLGNSRRLRRNRQDNCGLMGSYLHNIRSPAKYNSGRKWESGQLRHLWSYLKLLGAVTCLSALFTASLSLSRSLWHGKSYFFFGIHATCAQLWKFYLHINLQWVLGSGHHGHHSDSENRDLDIPVAGVLWHVQPGLPWHWGKKSHFLDFLPIQCGDCQCPSWIEGIEYRGCKIPVWAQLRSQPTLPRAQCTPKLLSCSSQEN